MADPLVAHDDLEVFLTTWYRGWLASLPEPHAAIVAGLEVDRVEPATGAFPAKLLVIRDDGGPSTSLLTAERSIGLTVLAGTKADPNPAKAIMRIVLAGLTQIPDTDQALVEGLRNPVAAVLQTFGAEQVDEAQDRARIYAPATLGVTAIAL